MIQLKNFLTSETIIMRCDKHALHEAEEHVGMITRLDPNAVLSYGGAILNQLRSSLSRNFNVSVKDFGPQIYVELEYNNVKTARSASMSFIIVLTDEQKRGFVKSSSVRYRSVDNYQQAVTYIISRKSELVSRTEGTN